MTMISGPIHCPKHVIQMCLGNDFGPITGLIQIQFLAVYSNSAFTLATSEPCQTGLVSFSKVDISRTTGTWQVSVVLLISAFENETKPVWHSSEFASVNAL